MIKLGKISKMGCGGGGEEREYVYLRRALGTRAACTRYGVRSPQPHWGISIPFRLDHRRSVGDTAEKFIVAADMELIMENNKEHPLTPFCQDLLFAPTADHPGSASTITTPALF